MDEEIKAELNRIARELKTTRELASIAINYIINAEKEVPERIRRFTNYAHDLHSMKWMYDEQGCPVPEHLNRELERVDDRYRQLLKGLHTDGGAFEKIRREMASDSENRYDHTRLLFTQEKKDETRKSDDGSNGLDQSGTEVPGR